MKTFVIFDRKTGEVLQTHVQAHDRQLSAEELLRMARPEVHADGVDILAVDALEPGPGYRVDVKARTLVPVEGGAARGAGGGSAHSVGGDPRTAQRVTFRVEQKRH